MTETTRKDPEFRCPCMKEFNSYPALAGHLESCPDSDIEVSPYNKETIMRKMSADNPPTDETESTETTETPETPTPADAPADIFAEHYGDWDFLEARPYSHSTVLVFDARNDGARLNRVNPVKMDCTCSGPGESRSLCIHLAKAVESLPESLDAAQMESNNLHSLVQRATNAVSNMENQMHNGASGGSSGSSDTSNDSGGSSGGSSGGGGNDGDDTPGRAINEDLPFDPEAYKGLMASWMERAAGFKTDLEAKWVTFGDAKEFDVPEGWSHKRAGQTVIGFEIDHKPPWETGAYNDDWVSDEKKAEFGDSQDALREIMKETDEVIYYGEPHYMNVLASDDVEPLCGE